MIILFGGLTADLILRYQYRFQRLKYIHLVNVGLCFLGLASDVALGGNLVLGLVGFYFFAIELFSLMMMI